MTEGLIYKQFDDCFYVGTNTTSQGNAFPKSFSIPENITIPSHINGTAVKAIGQYSFYRCLEIRHVKIYAQIDVIFSCAFFGCSNLCSINIPSSCKIIDYCAIDGRNSQGTPSNDDDLFNNGPSISFDPGSSLRSILHSGISNVQILRIYIYDKIYPTNSTYFFGAVKDVKIYSPFYFKFCGYQTTLLEQRTNNKYHLNRIPFILISLMS